MAETQNPFDALASFIKTLPALPPLPSLPKFPGQSLSQDGRVDIRDELTERQMKAWHKKEADRGIIVFHYE